MKRVLLILVLLLVSSLNAQTKVIIGAGAGYAQNGGFGAILFAKKPNSFGFYYAVRGLNAEGDFSSGVDFSSISTTKEVETTIKDTPDFGMTMGTIYNLKDSQFSIGAGVGYGVEQKLKETLYLYDFEYIDDEYRTQFEAIQKYRFTAEVFVDYSLSKTLKNNIGVQVGYNTLHKAFGILYYAF